MNRVGVTLDPLDVLFFRDARPFAAEGRAAGGGLPLPQTLAGAVRTALLQGCGANFGRMRPNPDFRAAIEAGCPGAGWIADVTFRGPWLMRDSDVLVPTPAALHRRKKSDAGPLIRLAPLPATDTPPGYASPHGLAPLWHRGLAPTEPAGGFLTPKGLAQFLAGGEVDAKECVTVGKLFAADPRTGLEIDPARLAAADGQLYGRTFLALCKDVRFYAELCGPPELRGALGRVPFLAFGGEGRRVRVETTATLLGPKSHEPAAPGRRIVLLTTPGLFGGALPQELNGRLAAAAVPNPLPVSGWDLAKNGPKPARFAAPAGSTYFLLDSAPAAALGKADDAAVGYGSYVTGVWTDA